MTTSKLNAESGTMIIDLARLSPDALGEILRSHVYGAGKGYRDMNIDDESSYTHVIEPLPDAIVNELLGEPEFRDEWMKVHAWTDDILTIAYATDGDTSLLFQIVLPTGTRTIVNHDAKCDYGWCEVDGLAS